MASDRRLHELVEAAWERDMRHQPEWATFTGWPGRHDGWTDWSTEAIAGRIRNLEERRNALHQIDRSELDDDDRTTWDLFEHDVTSRLDAVPFRDELQPLNQLEGPHQDPAMVLAAMPAATDEDREDHLARLRRLPTLIEQQMELMDQGLRAGITPPQVCLRDVPDQVRNQLVADPHESALLVGVPASDEAAEIFTTEIAPAYQRLLDYLTETYVPGCRQTTACRDLPDGEARYAHRVRVHTTTDLSPEEIHELGLGEVERIGSAMRELIGDVGFDGGFTEFSTFLATDDRFFCATPDELLERYRAIAARIDPRLPDLFGRLPRLPYVIEPVPSYAERSQTAAYYLPGAPDGSRPGTFFANTYDLRSRPTWEFESLTLHEAVPGHHLQIALAQEMDDLPAFRRNAWLTAFGEGWALYAESLGEDVGLYADPYSRYGAYMGEMWRSIRLVVDTGLHALGWTRDQAIEFAQEKSGRHDHDVVVEIDRYLVWPGQALAYKVGELAFQKLRRQAAATLGERFDLRSFHDEVLRHGCLPLDLLEARVAAWIATVPQYAREVPDGSGEG
jgi:uncharacterized protein (DUF885 family)